jgi:hypothetical protein
VRTDEWKLVADRVTGDRALYRIDRDPRELTDVSAQHQDVVSTLEELWAANAGEVAGLANEDATGPGNAELDRALAEIGYAGE